MFYEALVVTGVLLLAYFAIRASWRRMRQWPAVSVGFAGMNGLVILVMLMWVQLDLSLTFARISAFVLVALVALALAAHLVGNSRASDTECLCISQQIVDRSLCMNRMSGDSRRFRSHCASALTHPVTIAALVLLLLNDGLFKSLWPDAWLTGKLSDLAWVVFASPLLAFVLSLLLGRRRFGRRTAVLVSYIGLPALYAAFNTFEPVHDRILWGLSLVSGGNAGSPLDPSDSAGHDIWVRYRRVGMAPRRLALSG